MRSPRNRLTQRAGVAFQMERTMPALATPLNSWLQQFVPRLEQALGRPLRFQDDDEEEFDHHDLIDGTSAVIHDGINTIGRLRLERPQGSQRDAGFLAAQETVELFADVLSRLAEAQRKGASDSDDLSALIEIGRTAPQSDDFRATLGQLLRVATQLSGMWSAAFFLLDPRDDQLRLRATHRLPAKRLPNLTRSAAAESPEGEAWRRGWCVVSREAAASHQVLPENIAVGVAAPVVVDAELIGALWCYDRRGREIGDREIHVLQSVAAQIAAALERTALLEESAQRRQLRSDLRVASRQLPVGMLQLPPEEWGLDIAVRSATVTEVGGDLCDVIPLGDQRTLIAVGDAVGHSVPAAMLVSVARGALRALATGSAATELSADGVMSGLNRALFGVTRAEQFVTLVLGIIDSRAGTFTYANAGHPPLMLLRGEEWISLESHGLFLGVKPELNYASASLNLVPGDVLVWFTDGVIDAINPAREVFRRQGIKSTISAAGEGDAQVLAETIWRRLSEHDHGRPLRDDRTLLVLKFLGGG